MGRDGRGYWFLLALDLGLLMLASYTGLILLALIVVFTPLTVRGRAATWHPEPWIALLLLCIVVFPHALWFSGNRSLVMEGIDESIAVAGRLSPGLWLCFVLVLTHLGLALLVMLASGWPRQPRERAPEIERNPVDPFARIFIYAFALTPALVAIAIAFASRQARTAGSYCAAGCALGTGDGGRCRRQDYALPRTAGLFGLGRPLIAPPVLVAAATSNIAMGCRH